MVIDRNHLAAGLFTRLMGSAERLNTLQPNVRKDLFNLVTDMCFEMADAFIARSADIPVKD